MRLPVIVDRGTTTHRLLLLAGAVAVLLALATALGLPGFTVFRLTQVLYLAVAVLGLVLLTGHTGIISLGQGAFFAVGAYVTGLLVTGPGVHYLLALLAAVLVTFVLGWLIGRPVLRLRGLGLAVITLALALLVPPLLASTHLRDLTGGAGGLSVPAPVPDAWTGFTVEQWGLLLAAVVLLLGMVVARLLVRGDLGRSMAAIRADETVAVSVGIDVGRTKTLVFATSSAYAGAGGGLYALTVAYVSPESFSLFVAIELLAAVIVGGATFVGGALLGAVFVTYAPVLLADADPSVAGIAYGVVLILVVLLAPAGLAGLARSALRRVLVLRDPDPALPPAPAGGTAAVPVRSPSIVPREDPA